MKKSIYKLIKICLLFALLVVSLSSFVGCNNEFARKEYSSNEIIAGNNDRSAKLVYAFTGMNNKLTVKAKGFDGRETLLTKTFDEAKEYNLEISFSLSQGKAKIVFIDDKGVVATLLERTAENSNNNIFSTSLTFTKGRNRIKLVGYDCKNINLSISFEEN